MNPNRGDTLDKALSPRDKLDDAMSSRVKKGRRCKKIKNGKPCGNPVNMFKKESICHPCQQTTGYDPA